MKEKTSSKNVSYPSCICFTLVVNVSYPRIKPIVSIKNNHGTNSKLVAVDEISNDNEEIAEELSIFFQNAFSNLNIQENSIIQGKDYHRFSDPV